MGDRATGIMFHHLGPEPWATSLEAFGAILDRYRDRLVAPEAFLEAVTAGTISDQMVITLDDGLRSQWEIAKPILDARGLGAFWFVSSAPLIGEPLWYEVDHWIWRTHYPSLDAFYGELIRVAMNKGLMWPSVQMAAHYLKDRAYHSDVARTYRYWRDCHPDTYEAVMNDLRPAFVPVDAGALCAALWITRKELASLQPPHAIGSHTHSHPMQIDRLLLNDQCHEYERSLDLLYGLPAFLPALAHPGGRYGPEAPRLLREAGYQIAFRSDAVAGPTVYELPRLNSASC